MNEKSLNNLLASAIKAGHVPLEIDDAFVDHLLEQPAAPISEGFRKRVKAKLKVRVQDAAIAKARSATQLEIFTPFGRFIETIREKARLDRPAVAERLRKEDEFVERLERGHVNPLQLSPPELADIVELFGVNLKILPSMLAATVNVASSSHGFRTIARSHGGVTHNQRGEDVERALEAFVRTVRPKGPARAPANISDEVRSCFAKLEAELKRRGRSDLLG